MLCPRCKENRIALQREYAGTSYSMDHMHTGISRSWFFPANRMNMNERASYRTIAICKNCGYTWTVSGDAQYSINLFGLIICIALIGFIVYRMRENTNTVSGDPMIINTDREIDTDIWSKEYTSIEDFKWSIDENGITLGDYRKVRDNCKIRLSNRYTVNGVDYQVTKLDGCFFCDDIKSVIVSEGVTEIVYYTFNSSGIEYLYLPETLETFDGFSYLTGLKKLYYGGSEEQWNSRFDPKDNLKNTEIIFNASPDEL